MNKITKSILIPTGLISLILTTGCVANDEYYAESTSIGVTPVYVTSDELVGNYYQSSSYYVRGYWPAYSRPYVQRQYYYYVW